MNYLSVFLGGGLGALIRYLLYLILPKMSYFPAGTLVANFFGCFIATVVFIYLVSKSDLSSVNKIFFITGFCGGLSTLSALSLELLKFIHAGEYMRAFAYIFVTLIVCTFSVIFGIMLMKNYFNIKL